MNVRTGASIQGSDLLKLFLRLVFYRLVVGEIVMEGGEQGMNKKVIVEKLAARFNLDTDQVKEVFAEAWKEKHKEQQARFEERLDEAVKEGKITVEQKKAILDKKAELQEERKKHREEIKKWAEENSIDLKQMRLLMPGLKGPHGGRHFGPGSCE